MLVLASKSPRRKELLEEYITSNFIIEPSKYEEKLDNNLTPIENVKNLAYQKGKEVHLRHYDDIVLSADTIVVLDNHIFGKPIDKLDAYNMLKTLSNKTHEVITAYSLFYYDKEISNYVVSKVTFNDLSDELINDYINTLSPLDKAGSYGIQDGYGHKLVKEYIGSLTNIIGLPVDEIKKDLQKVQNI